MPPKKTASIAKTSTVVPDKTNGGMALLRTQLINRYGEGRVVRRAQVRPYKTISTGSLTLDYATRVGGWVRGRMHELIGQEGMGKTTLCIHSMIDAQRQGFAVGFIDMEQTWDWAWAEANGLDTSDEKFVYVFPDSAEDVSDQLRMMCRTDLFGAIYIDSIGGMESKVAMTKEAEEKVMGNNAQVITRMVKNCAVDARKNDVAVVLVNQYRANLSGGSFDISAGPKALKYATTMKVSLSRGAEKALTYREGIADIPYAVQLKAKVERNKVAAMGPIAEFWLANRDHGDFVVGIDHADEALSMGIKTNVIVQGGGGNYTMPDGTKYRGRDKVLIALRSEPDLMEAVRLKAIDTMAGGIIPEVEVQYDEATS